MGKAVFLDSSPLGMISNPNDSVANTSCRDWAIDLQRKGTLVRVPEIADYETRRELIRANKGTGIAELDQIIQVYGLVPICTEAMRLAAEFWANLRIGLGKGGTDDHRLDADVIVSAQAYTFAQEQDMEVWIATDNVRHFQPLVDGTYIVGADIWQNITP